LVRAADHRQRHVRRITVGRAAGRIALLALIVLLFVYPLARLLAEPLAGTARFGGGWPAVVTSLGLALVTAAIAAPLGTLLAVFVATASGPTARAAGLTLWGLLLAPSYVLTTGWMIVFATPGLRTSVAGHAFFSLGGLLFLYVIKALPYAAFVARASLGGIGAGLAEAAVVHGLPRRRRIAIALRLLTPALATGFAVAAIETMQEFGIPATLGAASHLPLLTYAIYQRLAQTPTDFAAAAVLCWRLILIAGVLAGASLAVQRHEAALRTGRSRPIVRRPPLSAAALGAGALTAVLGCAGLLVPLAALAVRALHGGDQPGTDLAAVPRSLGFGLVAGVLATGTAVAILRLRAAGARRLTALLDAALIANMAVPGLVLGAGYIIAFNNDILPLYGTTALLLIAYAAGMIPLALRMIQGALGDLDRTLLAAARVHGLQPATRAIDIAAMLLAQPLAYGFLLVCANVMFELPISELLYPPGKTPLGVAVVTLDQMSAFAGAARLALLGLAAMAALAGVVVLGLRLAALPRRTLA
jgi:iron(III) transport system permease protein